MSEDKQKITNAVKEKDPKKVEAGRKLGMISKAAKEKKALKTRQEESKDSKESTNYAPYVAVASISAGL